MKYLVLLIIVFTIACVQEAPDKPNESGIDPNICENKLEPNRNICYVDIADDLDYSKCRELQLDRKDRCLFYAGGHQKMPELCGEIVNQTIKDECYFNARSGQEPKICENIEDDELKDSCYWHVYGDAINWQNTSPNCAGIPIPEHRDVCYSQKANKFVDLEYCDKISDEQFKADCSDRYAFNTGNIDYCVGNKDRCIESVAIDKLEPEKCSLIVNETIHDNCLFGIMYRNNQTYCYEMKTDIVYLQCTLISRNFTSCNYSGRLQDACIYESSTDMDSSVCADVNSDIIRDMCYAKNDDCEQVQEEQVRELCLLKLSKL